MRTLSSLIKILSIMCTAKLTQSEESSCECQMYVSVLGNYHVTVLRSGAANTRLVPGTSGCFDANATFRYECYYPSEFEKGVFSTELQCQEGYPPYCKEIRCPLREVAVQDHASLRDAQTFSIEKTTVPVETTLIFDCNQGWTTDEAMPRKLFSITCGLHGWNLTNPKTCTVLVRYCYLQLPENSNFIAFDVVAHEKITYGGSFHVTIGDEVLFSCVGDGRFLVNGSADIEARHRCSVDGVIVVPPQCTEVCGFFIPKAPNYITLDGSGATLNAGRNNFITINSEVTFTCTVNARWSDSLSRTRKLVCSVPGAILDVPPPCKARSCLVSVPLVAHYSVFVNDAEVPVTDYAAEVPLNSMVEWQCHRGFAWNNRERRVQAPCDHQGFVETIPTCKILRCPVVNVAFALRDRPTSTDITYGEDVTYECYDLYAFALNLYRFKATCEGSSFKLPAAACTKRDNCTIDLSTNNQTMTYRDRESVVTSLEPLFVTGLWTQVSVICKDSYEHQDRSIVKAFMCVADEKWEPELKGCKDRTDWLSLKREREGIESSNLLLNIVIGIFPTAIVIGIIAFLWLFLEKRRAMRLEDIGDTGVEGKRSFKDRILGRNKSSAGAVSDGSTGTFTSSVRRFFGFGTPQRSMNNIMHMPSDGVVDRLAIPSYDASGDTSGVALDRRVSDVSSFNESEISLPKSGLSPETDVDSLGSDKYRVYGGTKIRKEKPQAPKIKITPELPKKKTFAHPSNL